MLRLVFWILLGVAGCAHAGPSYPPLYPGPERAASEVAVLSGPIEKVDGVDVSQLGSAFSLLPGCHVVMLPASIGEGGVGGAWSADIRSRVYAIDMKPGHKYNINVRLLSGNHSVGTANVGGVEIKAVEVDAAGNRVRTWQPTHRSKEIEACRASAEAAEAKLLAPDEPATSAQPKPTETKEPEPAKAAAPATEPAAAEEAK